jgi:hypothetical protein
MKISEMTTRIEILLKHFKLNPEKMSPEIKRWKLLSAILLVGLTGVFISSCEEGEKPKTIPQLTTLPATDNTTTTAVLHGEITDDGNATITESGFVYSTVQTEPTVADEKIVVEVADDGMLEALVENLNSGSIYHVRAYATNSEGTGYGEAVDVQTNNAAPTAIDVLITGTTKIDETLTASYTYEDAENDAEGTSTFQWYRADNITGTNEAPIADATGLTYKTVDADLNKFIRFGITPLATAGTLNGAEVKSAFVEISNAATTVTFTYNGQEVTYGIILSQITGRRWMDRDLGAANAPTAPDDWANWGDVFQWGRGADGHQVTTRTGPNADQVLGAEATAIGSYSTTDDPGHALFIRVSKTNYPVDWRRPQNDNLWKAPDRINNPCPTGWHVPTLEEFQAEGLANMSDGYTKLKLNFGNVRGSSPAQNWFSFATTVYWTSSTAALPPGAGIGGVAFQLTTSASLNSVENRGYALACRCIKD